MIPLPAGCRVWIATGHTDMRRGMQGLALQVQEHLKRDPHAGDLYIFRRVILPATRPQLLAGARVGLSLAFVLLFAAELIGSKDGLGHLIHQGEEALRFDLMLAAIATFGLLGFFSDAMLMKLRARLLRGQMVGTQETAS